MCADLAAVVLTLNEERHLPGCLASLRWCEEVVVFDSFSTDRTDEIARDFGARLIRHPFANYAAQRNAALEAVAAEWVCFVDADERATPEVADEVLEVIRRREIVAWWIPRHNYIFGQLTLHAGWFPDYQLRLLQREKVRYDPARPVHELAVFEGPAGYLQAPLVHLNYDTLGEFVARQRAYADFRAGILRREGMQSRWRHLVSMPAREFYWRLVTLDGWRMGWHGVLLSALMGWFQYEVYHRLREG